MAHCAAAGRQPPIGLARHRNNGDRAGAVGELHEIACTAAGDMTVISRLSEPAMAAREFREGRMIFKRFFAMAAATVALTMAGGVTMAGGAWAQ